MPRFRVIHKSTGEEWEVEAPSSGKAREIVGWIGNSSKVLMLQRGPFADIIPPKLAIQLFPPNPGFVPICPECDITMVEKCEQELWWVCPSCHQQYHEWENKFYINGEF